MAISDIPVYADPTASSAERLDIAFRLARRFDAYLVGVVPEDAAMVGERFEKMLLQEAILGEWHMAIGLTEPFVTRWAHCADLVILGQQSSPSAAKKSRRQRPVSTTSGRRFGP